MLFYRLRNGDGHLVCKREGRENALLFSRDFLRTQTDIMMQTSNFSPRLSSVLAILMLLFVATGCQSCGGDVEPAVRMVIDEVRVVSYDPNYFEDDVNEGLADLYVEVRNHASQSVYFATSTADEAILPVTFDVEALSVELEDFSVVMELLLFDEDVATTQDPIALGLTFSPADFASERPEEHAIQIGENHLVLLLNWY